MSVFGKKVTTETVAKYLERFGQYPTRTLPQPGETQGVVAASLDVLGDSYPLSVDPIAEIEQLTFQVSGLVHATLDDTPADRVHGLLLAIGALNCRIPLGTLGYDPADGEVVLKYSMPVTGGEVRYEDFERVLVVIENVLAKHAPDLRAVVAGQRTARQILE